MNITEDQWADVLRRLDKQAAAIRDLRTQLKALTEVGATASTALAGVLPPWHPYVPTTTCVMCGGAKAPGRTVLTCHTCSALRNEIIRTKADRSVITRSACCSCGAEFKPQTRFLCIRCAAGHKIWAASQR